MARIKVSELVGDPLDYWVARAQGWIDKGDGWWGTGAPGTIPDLEQGAWHPSTNWAQGGPIIDREFIELTHDRGYREDGGFGRVWQASAATGWWDGDTPLIAAMRAYVAGEYGEEVECVS